MMKQEGHETDDERNDGDGLHDLSRRGPVNAECPGSTGTKPTIP